MELVKHGDGVAGSEVFGSTRLIFEAVGKFDQLEVGCG